MTDSYHTEMAVVYAIKGSRGLIKIGRAANAQRRLNEIKATQISQEHFSIIGTRPIAKHLIICAEKWAHWFVRDRHKGREWFEIDDDQALSAIAQGVEAAMSGKPMPRNPLRYMPGPTPIDGPLARWCAGRQPPWTLSQLAQALQIGRDAVRKLNQRPLDRRTELALERLAQLTDAAPAKAQVTETITRLRPF